MRLSFQVRRLLVSGSITLGLLFAVAFLYAQSAKPVTLQDLVQMQKAGFDDQMVTNAIAANGVSLDTSTQGLLALKSAGISDKVINAALASAARKSLPAALPDQDKDVPDEIGVYVSEKNVLTPLPVEVLNFKSSGVLGYAFSYGIKKAKFKGTVPGANSSSQLTAPVTVVLRCADGIAPTEYQLVALESKKDNREFTEGKIGLLGVSTGADKDAVQIKFERIARNTYRGTIVEMKKGEYGILAPVGSGNGSSSGKLYTFGVTE